MSIVRQDTVFIAPATFVGLRPRLASEVRTQAWSDFALGTVTAGGSATQPVTNAKIIDLLIIARKTTTRIQIHVDSVLLIDGALPKDWPTRFQIQIGGSPVSQVHLSPLLGDVDYAITATS